jgi:hypothetical protein
MLYTAEPYVLDMDKYLAITRAPARVGRYWELGQAIGKHSPANEPDIPIRAPDRVRFGRGGRVEAGEQAQSSGAAVCYRGRQIGAPGEVPARSKKIGVPTTLSKLYRCCGR